MNVFREPLSEHIWDIKYRYRYQNKIIDQTIAHTWHRIAKNIATLEKTKEKKYWEKQFYNLLSDFNFLPGGRIIAGAGTKNKVTLFNCFVMPIQTDSLPGIFNALAEAAFTLQQGGGVGYDFSILRPGGMAADETGGTASGPVSFMKIWDAMAATMQSSGARRGAMMGHLRCDHPDIETFIAAKSQAKQLQQFNLSVIITHEFMHAVAKNLDWPLVFPTNNKKKSKVIYRHWSGSAKPVACEVFRTIKARQLWRDILNAAYSFAEPGVIFEDTINQNNPLYYCEWISATNPCGEIPLPHYGACNLGSINLTQFITAPFTANATINWHALENAAALAMRFLDNVIDISHFPLAIQKQQAQNSRRVGLGITGLADAFVMLGIRYDSSEALSMAEKIMQRIAYISWESSADLAKSRGSFPLLKKKKYLEGKFVQQLPAEIIKKIQQQGMRNSHHNAIAPTGTISLLANNISNGLEPIFYPEYHRKIRTITGEFLSFEIQAYSLRSWQTLTRSTGLPPAWIDTSTLTPMQHLHMQAVMQKYVDNAISKTINLPENFPLEKLGDVYTEAFKLGLKGCTIFRPNPITGSILTTDSADHCCPNLT